MFISLSLITTTCFQNAEFQKTNIQYLLPLLHGLEVDLPLMETGLRIGCRLKQILMKSALPCIEQKSGSVSK